MWTRRAILGAMGGIAATGLIPTRGEGARQTMPAADAPPVVHDVTYRAAERRVRLFGPDRPELPLWTYADTPFPLLRVRRGDRVRARLENALKDHTSIHFHGLRLPNNMDGVQYITQPPVQPGESFTYDFVAEDAGTFFMHPHCDEVGQVGRGLAGLMIVDGDQKVPVDAEVLLAVKDWRLAEDGKSFLSMATDDGASRAGTFGTVRAVNGKLVETAEVPAGGLVRVRLWNLDATRVMEVGFEGAPAALIAVDGHRLEPQTMDARGIETWKMGPAMRADFVVGVPKAGAEVTIADYQGAEIWTIATLRSVDKGVKRRRFNPDILAKGRYPVADVARAERFAMPLQSATGIAADYLAGFAPDDPLAKALMDSLCVRERTFWAMDQQSWPSGDHLNVPPPLKTLTAGRSYVVSLENQTAHPHPIHLHGHVFRVLSSERAKMPVHDADTVLVGPRDRVEIAFVAQEGRWMFHCHILEHLEYGMMGYLKVV